MPVISGAILAVVAVGAAVGTAATVAAVATAIVSVSIAIGTIGLAVTAVGMITGNQTILKIGEIMGYVGLAGGVLGGVVGGLGAVASGGGFLQGASAAYSGASAKLGEAWKQGVGSWFDDAAGAAVKGPVGSTPMSAVSSNAPPVSGVQSGINPAAPSTSIGPYTGPGGTGNYTMVPDLTVQAGWGTSPSAPTAAIVAPPIAPPAPSVVPVLAPGAPSSSMVPPAGSLFPSTPVTPQVNPLVSGGSGLFNAATPEVAGSLLPDWVKYAAMTSGGQALSGALGGWFQGASLEEQIEFQRLQNSQREAQVQLLNKNNAYAPSIRFTNPAGVLNS